MNKRLSSVGAVVLAMGLAACGPAPVVYYQIAVEPNSAVTGTNCPAASTDTITMSGIDNAGTIAIYSQPGNKFVVDLGTVAALGLSGSAPVELNGTMSSGTYQFAGSWSQDDQGTPNVTTGVSIALSLTPSGPGFTGSATYQFTCTTDSGMGCGVTNKLAEYGYASSNGMNFSCSTGGALTGSEIQTPTETPETSTGVSQ